MRYILVMFVAGVLFVPLSYGQVDQQRMDRDIRIMESALNELFKTDASHNRILIGTRESITGSYLPGFGVLFTIPDRARQQGFAYTRADTEESKIVFAHPLNNSQEITEESIKNRISEFFINYAPSIGQLESNEKVMVIYGKQFSDGRRIAIFTDGFMFRTDRSGGRENAEAADQLPVISMSVTRQDLDELRRAGITRNEFQNRISTAIQQRGEEERKIDLQVFASVLETGLNENRDEIFRLRGKPSHIYLDNFGVIYQLDLTGSSSGLLRNFNIRFQEGLPDDFDFMRNIQFDIDQFSGAIDSIHFNIDLGEIADSDQLRQAREKVREEMERARQEIEKAREEYREKLPEIRRQQEEARQQLRERQRELREQMEEQREEAMDPEKIRESLENQLDVIRELMVDYGRTLSSLAENQSLFLIVNLQHSHDELPKRIDLRIAKEDLNRMERGQLTREQAIERIVERRI